MSLAGTLCNLPVDSLFEMAQFTLVHHTLVHSIHMRLTSKLKLICQQPAVNPL